MQTLKIGLPLNKINMADWLENGIVGLCPEYEKVETKTRLFFNLRTPLARDKQIVLKKLIADAILYFYKTDCVLCELKHADTENLAVIALCATVVAFRSEEERLIITEKISMLKEINIDGIFNFCLPELVNEWKELGKLTDRLLSQCADVDDVFELVSFMLGLEPCLKRSLVIDENKHLILQEIVFNVIRVFGKESQDLIFSSLVVRPDNIVIKEPKSLDYKLINCIKSLGKN